MSLRPRIPHAFSHGLGQLQTLRCQGNHSIERQVSARDWTFIDDKFESMLAPQSGQN